MAISELFDLTGKRALVTGGARGLGAWIARALAEAGAEVVVTSRQQETREKVEASAKARDLSIRAIDGQIDSEEGCQALADRVAGIWDGLDILVNNAGANNAYGDLASYEYRRWAQSFSENAVSVFEMSRLMLPLLVARATEADPARIITCGSIDGARASDLNSYSYGASKAASHHIGKHLAKALVGRHINSNVLVLGPFKTQMMIDALPHVRRFAGTAVSIDSMAPVGKIGEYSDIAGIAILLASSAGRYITGETITIDGGLTTLR